MKKLIKMGILAAAISASCSVFAATTPDVQVTFKGSMVSSSCNVSINNGQSTVDIGQVDTSGLKLGETSPDIPFTVDIKGCPNSVSSAKLDFEGDAFAGNSTVFALNQGTGNQMESIGMMIKDLSMGDGSYLKPNASGSPLTLSDGAASFPLAATMKIMKEGVDEGTFYVSTALHVIYE
ncbi:fimbrial protein [Pseudescherichia sp.]|uniref:fimbrial protein n=1 Tax=Pseudescherichia sp. TaxID=2055881 RepID=UPI00289AC2C1|nr:fimbrial protein [Pseudescherichia sp.]